MFSDWNYMISTVKSYILEKPPRIHVNTTNIENILLPWVVLGLITVKTRLISPRQCPKEL